MIIATTGHRPKTLGGYSRDLQRALNGFALRTLDSARPSGVIVGMALGWDQAVAIACVRLGIPFTAAVPFEGQDGRWPVETQAEYRVLLDVASMVHVVCTQQEVEDGGVPWAMQERNCWMVDNSTGLLALWSGAPGGTANCVRYAMDGRREVENVWTGWQEWWDGGLYLV